MGIRTASISPPFYNDIMTCSDVSCAVTLSMVHLLRVMSQIYVMITIAAMCHKDCSIGKLLCDCKTELTLEHNINNFNKVIATSAKNMMSNTANEYCQIVMHDYIVFAML